MATTVPLSSLPLPAGVSADAWLQALDTACQAARTTYPSEDTQRRITSAAKLILTGGVQPAGTD
jgi:hypothetical protein